MPSFHDWRNPDGSRQSQDPIIQIEPRMQDVWSAIAIGVIYFLCTQISRTLDPGSLAPALLWPADGIAIGILLMSPRSRLWLAVGAVFFANLLAALGHGMPLAAALVGSVSNAFQVGASVLVVQLGGNAPLRALSQRMLLSFLLMVVGVINVIAAFANAAAGAVFAGRPIGGDFVLTLTSDALGIVLFAPLIVAWGLAHQRLREGTSAVLTFKPWRILEAVVAVSAALALTGWLFSASPGATRQLHPQIYLLLPVMLWIAMRFGLRMITSTLLLVGVVAIFKTALVQVGALSAQAAIVPILETQAFLMALAISITITASVLNERRVAQFETIALQGTFQSVLRASGNLVFEIDTDTRTIRWIGDPERVVGWSAQTISTIDQWNARIHPDDRPRLVGIRQRLIEGVVPSVDVEYRVINPSGDYATVGVNAYGAEVQHVRTRRNQRRIIGFLKNISRQKLLAKEREELANALRQAQKMESIGQLAGGIAHDFNNVLAAILGYTEMARDKLKTEAAGAMPERDAALGRYLATIERAGERGRGLTSQILAFSRSQPARVVPVDMRALIEEVVALIRGSHGTPVDLKMPSDEALEVSGDATSLHQLVMNLCTNGMHAIDAARDSHGSHVTDGETTTVARLSIEVEAVSVTQTLTTTQGLLASGRYLRIVVADQGVGIAAEVIEKMFDPFFTTKAVGKGTGLGLSLALSIARAHAGGLHVESELGRGTAFTVYLPTLDSNAIHPGEAASNTAVAPSRGVGQLVLLVDDDADLRELGSNMLTSLGYQVTTANSGAEALAIFEAAPDRFAVIVSDEVMPELTGTQLAAEVHRLRPTLPFVIVTAYGGTGFALRAQAAGVFRIVSKPYSADTMSNVLAAALSSVEESAR